MNKVRAILPCAGLGSRMAMPLDKSKEMLIDPITKKPLIQWSLDLCKKYKLSPLIITRKEKQDLVEYVCKKTNADILILGELQGEWPTTILRSENHWYQHNILLLPDTRFQQLNIINNIKKDLKVNKLLSMGLHDVDDLTKWGAVKFHHNYIKYCEKPNTSEHGKAWGVIGFNKKYGKELFENMSNRNYWHSLNSCNFSAHNLKWFKDITRNGIIENYGF